MSFTSDIIKSTRTLKIAFPFSSHERKKLKEHVSWKKVGVNCSCTHQEVAASRREDFSGL